MFHRIRNNTVSKYDISRNKFKVIILTFNFIFKYFLYRNFNQRILFTFDDGYISQLIAARYLARYYKANSIIFISTDFVDLSK